MDDTSKTKILNAGNVKELTDSHKDIISKISSDIRSGKVNMVGHKTPVILSDRIKDKVSKDLNKANRRKIS